MTALEKALQQEIENLKAENLAFKGVTSKIGQEKKSYSFSKMTDIKLKECVTIIEEFNIEVFKNWFDYKIDISDVDIEFLTLLINKYSLYLDRYKEESLKPLFIFPILNRVDFSLSVYKCSGLYEEKLTYEADNFIFNGTTDFTFAKGLIEAEKPYFFIQEFKRNEENSFPRPQLLAELISAVELNNWTTIKGAYIKGAIWNFVILEKLEKDRYRYFVSPNFDSTKIEYLKDIYKNLQFIKYEVIEMIKKEK